MNVSNRSSWHKVRLERMLIVSLVHEYSICHRNVHESKMTNLFLFFTYTAIHWV